MEGGSRKDPNVQRDTLDLRELVWKLEKRVDQQGLVLQALFALVARSQGLTEPELLEEVQRLERDRRAAALDTCAKCGRVMASRALRCLYCGEARAVTSPFDTL